MPPPERQLRTDFRAQAKAIKCAPPGEPPRSVGELVGCVYVLRNCDDYPLYVGKSTGRGERLGARVGRHVLGQRSDAAGRAFPPYEVSYMDVIPARLVATNDGPYATGEADLVVQAERAVYWRLVRAGTPTPLNEQRPPKPSRPVGRLRKPIRVDFTTDPDLISLLYDVDVRVERWAEVIRFLSNRIKTGGGTANQRRVLKLQAERLLDLV